MYMLLCKGHNNKNSFCSFDHKMVFHVLSKKLSKMFICKIHSVIHILAKNSLPGWSPLIIRFRSNVVSNNNFRKHV